MSRFSGHSRQVLSVLHRTQHLPRHFPLLNTSKVFQCFLGFSYREKSVGNAQRNLGNDQLSLNCASPTSCGSHCFSPGMSQGVLPGPFPASLVLRGKADKIPNLGTALPRIVPAHPEAGGHMCLFELLCCMFTPRTCNVPQTHESQESRINPLCPHTCS